MITETMFRGGAYRTVLDANRYIGSLGPRVWDFDADAAGRKVFLPRTDKHGLLTNFLVFANTVGTNTYTLRDHADTTNVETVAANEAVKVWIGAGEYHTQKKSTSTAGTITNNHLASIPAPSEDTENVIDVFNRFGSCELPDHDEDVALPVCVLEGATLWLWDNGNFVDGDRISIVINGVTVNGDLTLPDPNNKYSIDIDTYTQIGWNVITITALNSGSVPPNTTAVIFTPGVCEGSPNFQSIRLTSGASTDWLLLRMP